MAAIQQKRKRDSADLTGRPPPAPALSTVDHEFDQSYLHADDDAMEHGEVDFDAAFPATEQETAVQDEEEPEQPPNPEPKAAETSNASDTAAAAAAMAQYHTMTVPQSTEQSFMSGQKEGMSGDTASAEPGSSTAPRTGSFGDFEATAPTQASPNGGDASPGKDASSMTPSRGSKPPVGTEEWHKIRKDNHKEVERRRRETINEGINELAKIVPGCEKNKGSILSRAVQFITQLKENETQNIEKWTLEKLLTEQAIQELSASVDKLKAECERAWTECEQWKRAASKAGVGPEGPAKGGDGDAEGEELE